MEQLTHGGTAGAADRGLSAALFGNFRAIKRHRVQQQHVSQVPRSGSFHSPFSALLLQRK